ncbi:hypothetical protein NLU13_8367 [Sarocladium strictum]|uniref:Nudix hydrolase domain-containing protein n=1 Tax=Sarocladium strictum TaxID=5046 RepID=A0AA39GD02_SARSR|nr:hypothetical protein NLU13_8367 [Sarocladium strictum]
MTSNLLDLITRVDNVPLDFQQNFHPYYRLFVHPDPHPHGYIHPKTIESLTWPPTFTISHPDRTVTLTVSPSTPEAINASFQEVIDFALASPLFPSLTIHSEPFLIPGLSHFPDSLVHIERFASSLFGIATRGSHLTAYLPATPASPLRIWVARRSRHLVAHPSLLDSSVAGGVKATDSPLDCILAESHEEASLSREFVARNVRAVGAVTLANINPRTELFHAEILYVYDLEMPPDVVPVPEDDEVEEFVLMDFDEVMGHMLKGEFKPNVCGIMIDFLIRHGIITPENEPDYVDICSRLHRVLPMPTKPPS